MPVTWRPPMHCRAPSRGAGLPPPMLPNWPRTRHRPIRRRPPSRRRRRGGLRPGPARDPPATPFPPTCRQDRRAGRVGREGRPGPRWVIHRRRRENLSTAPSLTALPALPVGRGPAGPERPRAERARIRKLRPAAINPPAPRALRSGGRVKGRAATRLGTRTATRRRGSAENRGRAVNALGRNPRQAALSVSRTSTRTASLSRCCIAKTR